MHSAEVSTLISRAFLPFFTVLALICFAQTADGQFPPLIPRDVIFGNVQKEFPQISPDGSRLAYLAPENDVVNIWVKTFGKQDDEPVTRESHRPIFIYRWAADREHILYEQDTDGDENWYIYSVELKTKHVRDLTPFLGIKAQNLLTSSKHRNEILVGLNLGDPPVFDR